MKSIPSEVDEQMTAKVDAEIESRAGSIFEPLIKQWFEDNVDDEKLLAELGKIKKEAAVAKEAAVLVAKAINEMREPYSKQLGHIEDVIGRRYVARLTCSTVHAEKRVAECPEGTTVTGCSAGGNRGSYDLNETNCTTHDANTDWTRARCCRIELSQEVQ